MLVGKGHNQPFRVSVLHPIVWTAFTLFLVVALFFEKNRSQLLLSQTLALVKIHIVLHITFLAPLLHVHVVRHEVNITFVIKTMEATLWLEVGGERVSHGVV
jgi:hypothetical protein